MPQPASPIAGARPAPVALIREDAFLSACHGHPVYAVDVAQNDPEDEDELVAYLLRHGLAHPGTSAFARIDPREGWLLRALGAARFYLVETALSLAADPEEAAGHASLTISRALTRPATPDDTDAVLGIATTAFRWSRFHRDPGTPDRTADEVKRRWAGNALGGARGSGVTVATVGGRVAGFLVTARSERDGAAVASIDLVAVHPNAQGRGVGSALVAAFARDEAPTAAVLQVGTQLVNEASLALYARFGFQQERATYVLHRHV